MSSDKRLWAKVDLGYFTNPKMSEVLDASRTAPLMHLASILHCAQHLTDGHASPRAIQRMSGGIDSDADLLIQNGLWHAPGHDCDECPQPEDGKVYVHNYLRHNRSSDDAKDKSEQASLAAQERWRKEREKQSAMRSASDQHADRNTQGMQSAMQIEREEKIDRKESRSASAEKRPDVSTILDRLDQHCDDHGFKKPNRTESNINSARLLLDNDKRTVEQVLHVIDWASKSDFWPDKIRSMAKLRKQFDTLQFQSANDRDPKQQRFNPNDPSNW